MQFGQEIRFRMLVRSRPFNAGLEFIINSTVYTLAHKSHSLIKKMDLEDLDSNTLLRYRPVQVFSVLYLKGVSTSVAVTVYNEKEGCKSANPLSAKTYQVLREQWLRSSKLQGFSRMETPTPDGVIVQEIMVVAL